MKSIIGIHGKVNASSQSNSNSYYQKSKTVRQNRMNSNQTELRNRGEEQKYNTN